MASTLQKVRECVVAAADAVLPMSTNGKFHDFAIDIALSEPVAVRVPDFTRLAALVGAAVRSSILGDSTVQLGNPNLIEVYITVSTNDRKLWHDRPVEPLSECINRIKALGELEMPPRPKPPEFLELEKLIREAQSAEHTTASEREILTSTINMSLASLSASLKLVETGEIANRLNYQKNSTLGSIYIAIPQAGMRSFWSNAVEVIHTPPNRHPKK